MNHNSTSDFPLRSLLISIAIAAISLPAATVAAEDWPQFRGPNRDGMSAETELADGWPESGPTELWRVPLGDGYSGISVVGDRLYTMYSGDKPSDEEDAPEFAAAHDIADGKLVWKTLVGKRHDTEFGNGPRATPTVDGDTVYVLGSAGRFAALDTADGAVRWQLELPTEFGGKTPHWGFASSVLVDGDRLVLHAGGADGRSYVGLDKATGKVEWTLGEGSGYNSPVAVMMNGARRYIYVAGGKLMSVDGEGNEVWSRDWPRGETHATPLFVPPNRVYASGAEGVGAYLLEVTEADGKARVAEVWNSPHLRNHFNQSVYHDGHFYGFDNATLKCVAAADAKMAWRKRGFGKGSLTFADGKLYMLSDKGKLVMLKASPDGYHELAAAQVLEGRCWTAPTISGGRLYLRNQTEMVAYDIKG